MGLKENFHQAFRELLYGKDLGGSKSAEEFNRNSAAELNPDFRRPPAQPTPEPAEFENADDGSQPAYGNDGAASSGAVFSPRSDEAAISKDESAQNRQAHNFVRRGLNGRTVPYTPVSPASQIDDLGQSFSLSPVETEEMTIISKNTMIVGDIHSLANITIDGNVRGTVNVLKNANLTGALVGDLVCNNSVLHGSSIEGNVNAKNEAYIDNDSILLGDMKAHDSNIDGKIKGNIDIGNKLVLQKNTIISGNIHTGSIAVEDGANIKGYVNTAFFSEHEESAFPSQIIIGDEKKPSNDDERE